MAIKILHAADFHLDAPLSGLPEEKAKERRREMRATFEKLADICEKERVQLLLLSGDLFDTNMAYQETIDAVSRTFAKISAEIFISPGNHDYLSLNSPYNKMTLPSNVHIFSSPSISRIELPALNCRVWGAGFTASQCGSLLTRFNTGMTHTIDIMAIHGDTFGGPYNPITNYEIESSGLDYLALGHVHSFDGFHKSGKTTYAYPGIPEGRGFDETGEKGYIIGMVDHGTCDLRFESFGGRQHIIRTVDLTGVENVIDAVNAIQPEAFGRDICRIVLTGEYDGTIDTALLSDALAQKFYHTEFRNETRPCRDLWSEAEDDTLKGLFITRLREKYENADENGKKQILRALQFGIGALENREEWC